MVKKLLIALLCIVAQESFGQKGTRSPYSFFGIGELRTQATVENQMMGGLSLYADSIHVNLRNPAAYAALRRTTYTASLSRTEYRFREAGQTQNTSLTTLNYLALGFPISKNAGIGFGLLPFSAVGYHLVKENAADNTTNTFTGEGSINRIYFSAGWEPLRNLSLGATANFNFGTLTQEVLQAKEGVELNTLDTYTSRMNGFNFDVALNYTPTIKDTYTLYTAVIFHTQTDLASKNKAQRRSFSTVTEEAVATIDIDLDAVNLRNTTVKIPVQTTFGLGFGKDKKWFAGAEYRFQPFDTFESAFPVRENATYSQASSYALGGYVIPDYEARFNYLKKITYRAGLRYEVSGLEVDNEPISTMAVTFGFGFPLGNHLSNLNLGVELGQRGSPQTSLVEENYLKINIALSLNDQWFIKRKID